MSRMSHIEYHVHTGLNLIEAHFAGVVQLSDLLSYTEELLSLDLVTEGTIEYADLSEMTNFSLDYKSAIQLDNTFQKMLTRGWQGSVVFTPQEYQFGIIRMIGAVAGSIEGALDILMIPIREPISLDEVRDLIAQHRQTS